MINYNVFIILCNCNFTNCNLRIHVTRQRTDMEHPNDMEMSKHVAVHIL